MRFSANISGFSTIRLFAFAAIGHWLAISNLLHADQHDERVALPTINDYLLKGDEENFYMYVYRNFEQQESRPWTGGQYGFVRSMKRTAEGVICTKFHEGIDIKPIKRDGYGRPLDDVNAMASGEVVYVNATSHHSSYGKYVVVEHRWKGGPVYSLYAHLASIAVKEGQKIMIGQTLGKLGYTGNGINRERAHLHLELGVIFSSNFTPWHDKYFPDTNHHGNYNGMNIAGLDVATFLIAKNKNQQLTIPEFVTSIPIHYKVVVPRKQIKKGSPEIARRYPWMVREPYQKNSPSVEISFSASGFPLAIGSSDKAVAGPTLSWVEECQLRHEYHTKGYVTGTGKNASLSKSGLRFIALVCGQY
ncbi:MAG: M23 family metallopeptidase [Akkermansiaceae bacterium]